MSYNFEGLQIGFFLLSITGSLFLALIFLKFNFVFTKVGNKFVTFETLRNKVSSRALYFGLFFISLSTLALEIAFSRLLSVIMWYHLAFLIISTSMLGMTAGAITVFVKPEWFGAERLMQNILKASMTFSLVIPFVLTDLCLISFDQIRSNMSILLLFKTCLLCMLPFYFSGIVISAILTKTETSIGAIYSTDLIGAATGALFILLVMSRMDVTSSILLCGSVGALSALFFAKASNKELGKIFKFLSLSLFFFCLLGNKEFSNLKPLFIRGVPQFFQEYFLEKWNSFSRVVVYKERLAPPQCWSPSIRLPNTIVTPQYPMDIDGVAGTTMRKFSRIQDIEHLKYDITGLVYYLRNNGGACIIGVGGGRDLQTAFLFGHNRIKGIDVNPIFIDLIQNEFRSFAGLADKKEVTLIKEDARAYLSSDKEKYSVIQMSLTDTWASTGAGAFSLTENSLYTIESWDIFLDRLKEDGIFTVSRWYDPENLGETGRIVSLAVAALLKSGITEVPSKNILMVSHNNVSTLLVARRPFSPEEISFFNTIVDNLAFELVITPAAEPKNSILKQIVTAPSLKILNERVAKETLNYSPPTDETPYFFNMMRLRFFFDSLKGGLYVGIGVIYGNIIASTTLVVLIFLLLLLTIITIILPVHISLRKKRETDLTFDKGFIAGAIYFSLIGAGFIFVEMGLLQKLSLFLSHPTYSLSVLLFSIILSTGIGSFISEKLPLTKKPWIYMVPLLSVIIILFENYFITMTAPFIFQTMVLIKIVFCILLIFPVGLVLGLFFPMGMRFARQQYSNATPWFWGLNGVFGVLCSAIAVFVSVYFAISINFYLAALCYGLILPLERTKFFKTE